MFTIRNYVVAESLEQAYELNQKKNNVVLGGIGWLKMGGRNIQTAIDLSTLGLDKIEEDEESPSIVENENIYEEEIPNGRKVINEKK